MFVELVGLWIDGPVTADALLVDTAKQIDWPQGEAGTIALVIMDQDGRPLVLDLAGSDTLTLAIGLFPQSPITKLQAAAVAGQPGHYTFALGANGTNGMSPGKLAYDVWATKGGRAKQVVRASYFNVGVRMLG